MYISRLTYREPEQLEPLRLPVSKSIASRLMLMASLGGGNPADLFVGEKLCDDLQVMLKACGFIYRMPADKSIELDIKASGTAKRLLTAVFASLEGVKAELRMESVLAGRPMGSVIDILSYMCAGQVVSNSDSLSIRGVRPLGFEGTFKMPMSASSQVYTALMYAGALSEHGIKLQLSPFQVSIPYIEMTASLMRSCGVEALVDICGREVRVNPGKFTIPSVQLMERDWSAASYFYLYALLSGRDLEIEGLCTPSSSLQGDSKCAVLFERLGVYTDEGEGSLYLKPRSNDKCKCLDISLRGEPDLVPALAVACTMTGTPFCFRDIAHLRHKESNRLEALKNELKKYGIPVETGPDYIRMKEAVIPHSPAETIETYADHRIAMAFAQTSVMFEGVIINNPKCTDKSFPGFWKQMEHLGVKIE